MKAEQQSEIKSFLKVLYFFNSSHNIIKYFHDGKLGWIKEQIGCSVIQCKNLHGGSIEEVEVKLSNFNKSMF